MQRVSPICQLLESRMLGHLGVAQTPERRERRKTRPSVRLIYSAPAICDSQGVSGDGSAFGMVAFAEARVSRHCPQLYPTYMACLYPTEEGCAHFCMKGCVWVPTFPHAYMHKPAACHRKFSFPGLSR